MSTPPDHDQTDRLSDARPRPAKKAGRARRWIRRLAVLAVVLGILLGIGWWGLKGPITRAIVLSKLQQALGSPVEADVVELRPDGSLLLRGVRLRAPTSNPQASEVLTAEQIEVTLTLGDAGPVPEKLVITRPLVRLSRRHGTGVLNVLRLPAPAAPSGGGPMLLPQIEIVDGTLEFGEHGDFGYRMLKSVPLSGQVMPLPDVDRGGYTVTIVTASGLANSPSVPLRIVGSIGDDGVVVRLDRVRLQEWVPHGVPAEFRELIAALDLRGDVSSVLFTANMDGSNLKTEVALDGVKMTLPLRRWVTPSAESTGEPLDVLVRQGTLEINNAGLRAELEGVAAEMPVVVSLDHRGLNLDAPFDATVEVIGYQLTKEPQWLPYAPGVVRRRLDSFNKPTGMIDAVVKARREVAGTEPSIEGTIDFREVVAAFEDFPYEMRSLSGRARFTRDLLVIENITGVSDQGATIEAKARIEPPNSVAEVFVDVVVKGAPLDEAMIEAMGEERRRIVEALFHEPSYEDLLAKELIGPRAPDFVQKFVFGGSTDVEVSVHRALGPVSVWTRRIDVRLQEAGLIPEAFPLPVIAEDVTIRLDGDTARVEGGRFRTLTGQGVADISAEVDIAKGGDLGSTIQIEASDITVDERLVYAISNAGAVQRGAAVVTDAVSGLRLNGLVDCTATLTTSVGKEDEHTEYIALITLREMTAVPVDGSDALRLEGLHGTIEANNQHAAVRFEGRLAYREQDAGAASLTLQVSRGEDAKDDARFAGTIHAVNLQLDAPVEQLVAVFAQDNAHKLQTLREEYQPVGRATMTVELDGEGESVSSTLVDVHSTDQAEVLTSVGRVWLSQQSGLIRYHARGEAAADAGETVHFIESSGLVGQNGQTVARYTADGPWPLNTRPATAAGLSPLSLSLAGIDAASPLTRSIARKVLPEALHDDMQRHDPVGRFGADLLLRSTSAGIDARGSLTPGNMSIQRGERRVAIDRRAGSILLAPESRPKGGAFQGLVLALGEGQSSTELRVDGGWDHDELSGGKLDLRLTADAPTGLNDDLLAMLPAPVSAALMGARVSSDQPMRVQLTTLDVFWSPGRPARFSLAGDASLRNAGVQVGAPVTGIDGTVRYTAHSDGVGLEFDIDVAAERLRLAGVRGTDGRVHMHQGEPGETMAIPEITAALHGGRLAGRAVLLPAEGVPGSTGFVADLRMASVAFADVLTDLNIKPEHLEEFERQSEGQLQDRSRGLMDARIGLAGVLGDVSSTVGSGSLVIGGGAVVDLPLVLPLIQVSNLVVPSNDRVDMAEATFVIQGDLLQFEKLSVFTPSVVIAGHGTMRWTDLGLDLRFASRRVRRIPMLSEAVERFRDELVRTKVTGLLNRPVISVEQFSGTRRLLSRLTGGDDSEDSARLDSARRLAAESERTRRVDDRASRFLTTPVDEKKKSDGGTP